MRIEAVDLYHLAMPLVAPFATSFGREDVHDCILVRVSGEGSSGWGEAPVMRAPLYNEETVETAWHMLRDFLVPGVLGRDYAHPAEVGGWWAAVRRNYMAKAGLEMACWDLWANSSGLSLASALGGVKERIPAGVSVGLQADDHALTDLVRRHLAEGYRRIKVKIKPGRDLRLLEALREALGGFPLMADANSAYRLSDAPRLQELDRFALMMLEQPLDHDDLVDHAALQALLTTPICLDESILSAGDARRAIQLGSCRVINIKAPRVGGLEAARKLQEACAAQAIPVWCGGLLETGIGRAHNLALASLPGFTLPGDTSPSSRYFSEDIIDPPVTMSADGFIAVPRGPGLGHAVVMEQVRRWTLRTESFTA